MRASLSEQLNQLPPCVVRYLAREQRHYLSSREIASRSNLPLKTVRRISGLTSWSSLRVDIADAFARGCNYDLLRPRRSWQYLNRFIRTGYGFSHLDSHQLESLRQALNKL